MLGTHFGDLTVLAPAAAREKYRRHWLCQCRCGQQRVVREDNLRQGMTTSCGCRRQRAPRAAAPGAPPRNVALRRAAHPCRGCGDPTVFVLEVDSPTETIVLLCPACLRARVAAVLAARRAGPAARYKECA
jgi:hypothetical protein